MARIVSSRGALGLVGAAALILALQACGAKEDESSAGGPSGGRSARNVAVDQALAGRVPASFKSDGRLVAGVDASYAPSEFLDTDGKTPIGFDITLFNAVAAKLGLRVEWRPTTFTDIIPGVQSGKYEVGVSSLTINADRERQVSMVSYFTAGTQWAAPKGSTITPETVCGKRVAVQVGTVQVDDVTRRSGACTTAGHPAITIDQYQAQSDATSAVVTGKDHAMLADSPVSAYAVKQTGGKLALIGQIYDSAPYGYVLAKDQQVMAEVLRDATKQLIADGTYRSILAEWGVDAGAMTTDPAVNP